MLSNNQSINQSINQYNMLYRLLRGGGNYLLYGISNRYFYHPPINHQVNGRGPSGSMSQIVGLPNNSYKPITNMAWGRARLCKLQKWCTQFAAASDKVYQLLAHGRWFSPGTPASSTTNTSRHDIAKILLKLALSTINQIKSMVNIDP